VVGLRTQFCTLSEVLTLDTKTGTPVPMTLEHDKIVGTQFARFGLSEWTSLNFFQVPIKTHSFIVGVVTGVMKD
jgi:hypothetical protein